LLEVDEDDKVELSHEHDSYRWLEIKDIDNFDTVGDLKALEKLGLV